MKNKNQNSIAILMGVYNGETYLESQIDSLFAQTNLDWTLYIRDDGSTDNTLKILDSLKLKYPSIIIIEDKLGNLWCKNNFYKLMEYVDSKYYMFCDQDDIWLPNKIVVTYNQMIYEESKNESKPIVVYTNLKVVDEKLNLINESFWHTMKIIPEKLKSFENLAVYNAAWGCTMMFNKKARDISMPIGSNAIMHDSYICMKVASENGIISSIDTPTILYRQHSKNAIGAQDYHTNYLKNKLTNLRWILQDNIDKYKMANDIRKFSVLEYLFYKLHYTFTR